MRFQKRQETSGVSQRMRGIARRDTAPERQLQKALRLKGLNFNTHKELLGCAPDIIFEDNRVAIFVDGDFWHGRLLTEGNTKVFRRSFKSESRLFWIRKITKNVERDKRQVQILRRHH